MAFYVGWMIVVYLGWAIVFELSKKWAIFELSTFSGFFAGQNLLRFRVFKVNISLSLSF